VYLSIARSPCTTLGVSGEWHIAVPWAGLGEAHAPLKELDFSVRFR
jgi:hypothetical protein